MVLCHIKPKRLNPGYVGSQKQHYQASQAALNIFQHPCSGLASQSFCFISFIFGEPTQFSPELRFWWGPDNGSDHAQQSVI